LINILTNNSQESEGGSLQSNKVNEERSYYRATSQPYIEGEKKVLNTINVVNSVKQKFSKY
jgi:hypothetical protein